MDGTQNTPAPERLPEKPAISTAGEQLAASKVETSVAPAVESQPGQVKRDDGQAQAAAQVASVTADDQLAAGTAQSVVAAPSPIAADKDVIEPAWVEKAQAVVAKYSDDPHTEEDKVQELQQQYLKSRYNLDVESGQDKP